MGYQKSPGPFLWEFQGSLRELHGFLVASVALKRSSRVPMSLRGVPGGTRRSQGHVKGVPECLKEFQGLQRALQGISGALHRV